MSVPVTNRPPALDADDVELLDRIVGPAAPQEKHGLIINEGYRLVSLGESGCGKTTLMRAVTYWTLMRGYARFALVHDTKGIFPEYPRSIQCADVADFRMRGGFREGDTPIVSFRGDPRRDIECSAESVAALSIELARQGITGPGGEWLPNPHVCVIDEVSEAATEGRKKVSAKSVLKLAEQGRKMGVSLNCTTQETINMPDNLRSQATCITFGRLTMGSLNYLDRINLDPAMVRAIRGPKGEGLPNFDFVVYFKGLPWDGKTYRLNSKTVSMFE